MCEEVLRLEPVYNFSRDKSCHLRFPQVNRYARLEECKTYFPHLLRSKWGNDTETPMTSQSCDKEKVYDVRFYYSLFTPINV